MKVETSLPGKSASYSACAMCSSYECPVFTETNLGTRLAVPISPDATARDFKRVLERAHLNCFPEHGEIKANGLMVQRKSNFYHLSDALPIKHAFQYLKGNWFLQVKVCHSSIAGPIGSPEDIKDPSADGADSTEPENFPTSTAKIRSRCSSRRRMKSVVSGARDKSSKERNACPAVESHYEALSETMSVSGIIRKYFSCYDYSSYDEVNSGSRFSYSTIRGEQRENMNDCRINFGICTPPPYRLETPLEMLNAPLRNEYASIASSMVKKAEVGKRLLTAANNLGFNASNRRRPRVSLIRSLVYEMADEDDD